MIKLRSLVLLTCFLCSSCLIVHDRFRIEVKDDKGIKLKDGVFCYIADGNGKWSKLPIRDSVVIDEKMNLKSLLCKKCGFYQVKVQCSKVGKDCGRYNSDDYDEGKNYIQINAVPKVIHRRVNYPNKNNDNYQYWDTCLLERSCVVTMKKTSKELNAIIN